MYVKPTAVFSVTWEKRFRKKHDDTTARANVWVKMAMNATSGP